MSEAWRVARCRSCDAPIFWALTESGHRMPVDAAPDDAGNLKLYERDGKLRVQVTRDGLARRRPHFATCPDADGWRKR